MYTITITIFGTPTSPPSGYQSRFAAVDRAKRELAGSHYPATACVTDTNTQEVVWTGTLRQDGKIVDNEQTGETGSSVCNARNAIG